MTRTLFTIGLFIFLYTGCAVPVAVAPDDDASKREHAMETPPDRIWILESIADGYHATFDEDTAREAKTKLPGKPDPWLVDYRGSRNVVDVNVVLRRGDSQMPAAAFQYYGEAEAYAEAMGGRIVPGVQVIKQR